MILNIDQRQQYLGAAAGCPVVVQKLLHTRCVTTAGRIKAPALSSWALWVEIANLHRCWKSGGTSAPCSTRLWHWMQRPPWIRQLGLPRVPGKAQGLQPARTVEPAGPGPWSASRANIWPKPAPRDRSTTSWRGPVGGSVSSIILLCKYLHFHIIFGLRKIWNYPFNQPGISTWSPVLKTCSMSNPLKAVEKPVPQRISQYMHYHFQRRLFILQMIFAFKDVHVYLEFLRASPLCSWHIWLLIELLYSVPASDTAVFNRCGKSSCHETHSALLSLFCSC